MTYSKETLMELIKLNASFMADAKKTDEVVCTFDIVQSLKWQLDDILETEGKEKSAPTAATAEADKENTSAPVYLTEEQLSRLPLHTRVITPHGAGTFEEYNSKNMWCIGVDLGKGYYEYYKPDEVYLENPDCPF